LHLLKYEQVRPAAGILGGMLAAAIRQIEFADVPVLMLPVPLYKGKLRQRGYNQAELIARAALKNPGLTGRFELNASLLRRVRETRSQTGLTRHQRRENLRGAFELTDSDAVRNREVLLVDDVFTTGTTASECARISRRAGASNVYVATVARTMKLAGQTLATRPAQAERAMAAAS
jgi:ComF family protein